MVTTDVEPGPVSHNVSALQNASRTLNGGVQGRIILTAQKEFVIAVIGLCVSLDTSHSGSDGDQNHRNLQREVGHTGGPRGMTVDLSWIVFNLVNKVDLVIAGEEYLGTRRR